MKKLLLITLILWAPAHAQTALCEQLAAQIERAQISMAQEFIDANNENSASRFASKEMRETNSWASISTSLTLMQSNRCTPIAHPISATAYIKAGLACVKTAGTAQAKSSCDTARWTPDYGPVQ